MNDSEQDLDKAYRVKFSLLKPILEKHFPGYSANKVSHMVDMFISTEECGLYETYDYKAQMENLAKFRHHLSQAARSLSKIHRSVESEITGNITLPIEVLVGKEDRKTCAPEIFDHAPCMDQVQMASHLFRALREMNDHIDKSIKYTMDYLPTGIPSRNRNIAEWKVVEGIVDVIRRYECEIHIPERMGTSGPLWRLLTDLLQALNLRGTADAAFNGWLQHIDRKRESFELLPLD